MVLLVAKEKLIAASVAWCHCRGVLSAGACLTHSVWNEQKQRGRFPSPESGSVLPDPLENLFFPLICRVSSPSWAVNTESETPDLQRKFPQPSTALRTLRFIPDQLQKWALLSPGLCLRRGWSSTTLTSQGLHHLHKSWRTGDDKTTRGSQQRGGGGDK